MTKNDQITELNSTVKVKLGVSKIHGIGVIAIYDLPKGTKVHCHPSTNPRFYNIPYSSLNKLFPEIRELILQRWPSIINGSRFMSPNDNAWLATFMNHSDEPNYEIYSDAVIRDVAKGEELTEDYRLMENYATIYPWLS